MKTEITIHKEVNVLLMKTKMNKSGKSANKNEAKMKQINKNEN